ncbi:InlB B-repeat-containing protein [Candidatus Saccharibacteria bacterium]|nr:InlB B-repeat-containing protein [Candidatus Saccharibacteria bacterium]
MKKRRVTRARKSFRYIALLAIFIMASGFFVIQSGISQAATVHNLVKYPKSKMTRITLKKVLSAKRPKGYGSLQGFAMTDKYYVLILRPPGQEDNNRVEVIRRSDKVDITKSLKNPTYNMGHGNDATWNTKTNEVIVIDGSRKQLVRIDAKTFKKKGTTKLTNAKGEALSGGGIAYDKQRNIYYMSSGSAIRTFNTKNQLVASFTEKHNQTNQGFAYNNGYLYRPTWESAGTYNNAVYDKIFKKNTTVLYQFGLDGSFTHAYYIDNPLYEVESMAFDENNVPYIAFNGPSGYYTIYKVTDSSLLKQLRQSYTISYYDNGGSGSPKDQTAYVGIEKTLSGTKPTRANYKFLGWSTNKSATKASYAPNAKYLKSYGSKNANVKLYAVWQKNTYTITYNANGGTGAPAAQTVDATKTTTLSKTTPTRANYTFMGWSTNKGATVATYQPGASYTGKTSITLYAIWKSNTYTITYNANGGTGAPAAQTATAGQATKLSTVKPTKSNHSFLGWATSQTATTAQYTAGASYTGNSNITLFAVWKENQAPVVQTITITYDANGGQNAPAATTGEVGKIVLSRQSPTRTYFTFLGWSTSKSANAASYQPGASYTGKTSITLYAVWEQKYAIISFDANGGTGAPNAYKIAMGQKFTIPATIPTRGGYKFLGWNISKDLKEAKYLPGNTVTLNNDLALFAIWEREPRTISFDANGGENAPLPISTNTDELVLPQTHPTRKGYVFVGWATKKDSKKADYHPGDIVKNIESTTLYAIWQVVTPMPIIDNPGIETDDKDENINDASAVNDGEDDETFIVTPENPTELPNTGPVETAVAVIACICVVSGAAYWIMSNRQLKQLQRSVRGHAKTSRKHRK